jgi:ferredoxin
LVCGFACPFGWLQDLLHRVPLPKFRLPRAARYLKYVALALLVVGLPLALGFDVSGYLKVAKPALAPGEEGQLQVTVTVANLGTEPVRGFELAPVYRRGEGGREVVSREAVQRHPNAEVEPGQSLTLPAFGIPNRLAEAELVIESPESVPDLRSHYDLYYCRICPNGTLTATLPVIVSGGGGSIYGGLGRSWLRLGILALFVVLMLFVSRPFCQSFCPLGAAYGLVSRLALARVVIDRPSCIECGACDRVCPVNLDVSREVGGPECIACGDCIGVCPKSAIRRTVGL